MQNRFGRYRLAIPLRLIWSLPLLATLALSACESDGSPASPDLESALAAPSVAIDVRKNSPVQQVIDIDNPGAAHVTASITSGPSHGHVQIVVLSRHRIGLGYTPDPDFFGEDVVEYRIQTAGASDEGVITFDVLNASPSVSGSSVIRPSAGGVTADLTVTDEDGDPLEFLITEAPSHGTLGSLDVTEIYRSPGQLSAYEVEVHYEPAPGFTGPDEFLLGIDEGNGPLFSARVQVLPNEAVVIQNLGPSGRVEAEGARGEPVEVVIEAAGSAGGPLEFRLADPPRHGTLGPIEVMEAQALQSGAGGTASPPTSPARQVGATGEYRAIATYEPDPGFAGVDRFEVTVSDGVETVAVPVEVAVVNVGPTALAGRVEAYRHGFSEIVLSGADPDGFPLEFEIVEGPSAGTLSAILQTTTVPLPEGGARTTATLEYTAEPTPPTENELSVWFTVSDGVDTSEPAEMVLFFRNRVPSAEDLQETVPRNLTTLVPLTANDLDGHDLEFMVLDEPTHGTLGAVTSTSSSTATVRYTPDPGHVGPDSFTFRVNDGIAYSEPAEMTLTVANDPPRLHYSGPVATPFETPIDLVIQGSDANGDALTSLEVVFPPNNGTLSAITQLDSNSFQITYTPDPGFSGLDPFSLRVLDDLDPSDPRTMEVTVGAAP